MARDIAAARAKTLLSEASQRLHTANPVPEVGDILEDALPLPVGDLAYQGERLFEPNFSEANANSLSFVMSTGGPRASAADRVETATEAVRRMVGHNFGNDAQRWLDSRIASAAPSRAMTWGASFGSGFDRDGVMESLVAYEWGPQLMDALPSALYRLARTAMEHIPGLRPLLSTIRCGRTAGTQQITFDVAQALPLESLGPLMDDLGLGRQHASLMSATAFVLGARFTLPPETSTLTLRPIRNGVELRLDVILDALPDVPSQMMSLLRLQMAERPVSLRALDRWLMALTPQGYSTAGRLSVLSVTVRPDMGARIALYLRPSALEGAAVETPAPQPVVAASRNDSWGAYGR